MTENDYWMNSPFGNESIFSPDFDIKQKKKVKKESRVFMRLTLHPKYITFHIPVNI